MLSGIPPFFTPWLRYGAQRPFNQPPHVIDIRCGEFISVADFKRRVQHFRRHVSANIIRNCSHLAVGILPAARTPDSFLELVSSVYMGYSPTPGLGDCSAVMLECISDPQ